MSRVSMGGSGHWSCNAHGLESERGSLLPLMIGAMTLALALLFVLADAIALHLAQYRLDGLAAASARAAASEYELTLVDDHGEVTLSADAAEDHARSFLDQSETAAWIVSVVIEDQQTVSVTLAEIWHAPVGSLLLPDGVPLEAVASTRVTIAE